MNMDMNGGLIMDEWTFTVIWRICVCLIALALYTYIAYQFGKSKAEIFDLDGDDPEREADIYHTGYSDGYAAAIADVIKSHGPEWAERFKYEED